ncbi:MAG: CRISPR-associated endonuclease Cas3'', partial [Gammaproteobacteria bacterium]|nr:CRISPR-associated endonuclease Cas3'' [Gammaproteobacteria bacterium]
MEVRNINYFKYWGKAREEGVPYHLLPFHCLDVATVADVWWEGSPSIQRSFTEASALSAQKTKAWLLFFVALHDYGKLDMRFQLKAPRAVASVYPAFDRELTDIDGIAIKDYFHGPVGFSLFYHDFYSLFAGQDEHNQTVWDAWQPWLAAVTGHHGVTPDQPDASPQLDELQADISIIEHDKSARMEWVLALQALFLEPAGLSIDVAPPPYSPLLAGFCSVADWLGSNSAASAFEYRSDEMALDRYYQHSLITARQQLDQSGLLSRKRRYQGVSALLPEVDNAVPRQLQTLVDQLPLERGLTLIEAPTGSGKTETALAYAWRLLAAGLADSIIFALPTQATANAMLKRLESCASLLFDDQPNLVLAHGKASFNEDFWQLKNSYQQRTEQGKEEARVQCAEWL